MVQLSESELFHFRVGMKPFVHQYWKALERQILYWGFSMIDAYESLNFSKHFSIKCEARTRLFDPFNRENRID